jgi:hypothetical protein
MKATIFIGLAIGVLLVCCVVLYFPAYFWFFPYIHDYTLDRFAEPLISITAPQKTQILDRLSRIGQQTGNSDHCDYFAAIVLKTELPKDEVESYYRKNYDGKSGLAFVWLNEKNNYTAGDSRIDVIHTLKDWIDNKQASNKANLIVYIFEVAMTSAIDYRCS